MVTEITTSMVRQLRDATGAGFLDCRNALRNAGGDFDKAVLSLRQSGMEIAAKKADRAVSEGVIEVYQHHNGAIGVMVEVNCETDFVARSDRFTSFARALALHIANDAPLYVRREDIPQHEITAEHIRQIEKTLSEGKQEAIVEKIVAGRMEKWYRRVVLMEQTWLHDETLCVSDVVNQLIAEVGENVVIRRFALFTLVRPDEDSDAD
jgi:elongation factor Ts